MINVNKTLILLIVMLSMDMEHTKNLKEIQLCITDFKR